MSEDSYMWNLDSGFKERMQALIRASEGRITVVSGYRSNEDQQVLYDRAVERYGEANAGKWAAKPGRSNHNHGLAMDISFANDEAQQWASQNAARFGLDFPMSWEPWHIEPVGLRNGTYDSDWTPDRDSYTSFQGRPNPMDEDGDFMNRMMGVLGQSLAYPNERQNEKEVDTFATPLIDTPAVGDESEIVDG